MKNSIFSGLLLGLGAVLLGAQSAAIAHEQAIGYTEIRIVPSEAGSDCIVKACRIEIEHRYSIHDAESTLMTVLGARPDLSLDKAAQTRFQAYVAGRFSIKDTQADQLLNLALIGGEVERGYYWVYQETEAALSLFDLMVSNTVLMDAIPQQTNRVNIRFGDALTTLIFSSERTTQNVAFD